MNNERRKAINEIATNFTILKGMLIDALEEISAIGECEQWESDLNDIKDNEEEAYNNMPESLQNGERGQTSQEAISHLETAIGAMETLREALDTAVTTCDEIDEALEQARLT